MKDKPDFSKAEPSASSSYYTYELTTELYFIDGLKCADCRLEVTFEHRGQEDTEDEFGFELFEKCLKSKEMSEYNLLLNSFGEIYGYDHED